MPIGLYFACDLYWLILNFWLKIFLTVYYDQLSIWKKVYFESSNIYSDYDGVKPIPI